MEKKNQQTKIANRNTREIMHFVILEQQSNTLMTAGAVPRILALQMLYGERVKGWASEGRGKREFYEAGRHGSISRSTHT